MSIAAWCQGTAQERSGILPLYAQARYLRRSTTQLSRAILLGFLLACSIAIVGGVTVSAAQSDDVVYVSSCTESGLNAALYTAQHSDKTTIKFKCDGTIRLAGVKKINRPITIDASDRKIILDGQKKT